MTGPKPVATRGAIAILERAQLRLAMLALAVMMLTTVSDVVLRYVFGRPIKGAYDMVEVCLAIFVFNGIATVFYHRQNIVIDVIDHLARPAFVAGLVRVSEAATVLLLAVMAWAMISPGVQAFDYGDRKLELGMPLFVVWIFAIAGLLGTALCALGALMRGSDPRAGGHP